MTPGLVQRHHDYVLGPNQDGRLSSVAAGQTITGLELHLDTDAPFLLRSRAMRTTYDSGATQQALSGLLARWAGPNRDYRSQDLIRQSLLGPYYGQLGNPIPVWPPVTYPRGGTILVDVQNDGTATLTNLTFYFRGVKLFAPGAVKSYEYPPTFATFPFVYPQVVSQLPVTAGPTRLIFRCKSDADFVWQSGQAGLPFSSTLLHEVFITLRDEDEKPYSNDAVHMDVMFGNAHIIGAVFGAATVGTGPNSPGLVYPEIYIPKNHVFYFDVSRSDAAYVEPAPVDFPFQLCGQKVFQK